MISLFGPIGEVREPDETTGAGREREAEPAAGSSTEGYKRNLRTSRQKATERLQKESEEFFNSPLFCISALALLPRARTQANSSSFAENPGKLCVDVRLRIVP